MRQARPGVLGVMCVAVLALGMVLSGCGVTSATVAAQGTVTNSPTPSPTAAATATTTPVPTATTPPTAIPQVSGCSLDSTPAGGSKYGVGTVGGLKVSIPWRALDYPSELMPNSPPNAPYQIAASAVTHYAPSPPVNPSLATGYSFTICNETNTTHRLTSMRVNIASFSARSGAVTVWHICQDGPYDAATKQTTGGCGGAFGGTWLAATLPHDSTGASAPVTGAIWPAKISPHKSIELVVAVNGLTSQGIFALSFGMSIDGATPTTVSPGDGSFLIAPSTTIWTGTACQTPAMQAQISPASQDTYYVCPPTS